MKFIAQDIEILFDTQNRLKVILTVPGGRSIIPLLSQLKSIVEKGKHLAVEIKQYREKRSKDANAYLWVMCQKIAEVIRSTKDEVYLQMLERYGVFTHIIVKPEAVERVKQEWRTSKILGEVTVNGKTGIQIQCYYGSHLYDSKEFSALLDGVISEAKELGIEVITESEKNRIIEEWGN